MICLPHTVDIGNHAVTKCLVYCPCYRCYNSPHMNFLAPLQWRHNGHDGVSNHKLHIVYSSVYSGPDKRKHQSSASLAFVWGINRWPVNCPHKWPVTRKCLHLMTLSCLFNIGRHDGVHLWLTQGISDIRSRYEKLEWIFMMTDFIEINFAGPNSLCRTMLGK